MTRARLLGLAGAAAAALAVGGAAAPQDAPKPPADVGAPVPAPAAAPAVTEFLAANLIRRPDGMLVHYYRVNHVSATVLQEELKKWATPKAEIVAVGPQFIEAPIAVPSVRDTPPKTKAVEGIRNLLRITESEDNLPVLRRILEMIDVPQPQVRVEAKVLELSWDDQTKIGIDAAVTRPLGDTFFQSARARFPNPLDAFNGTDVVFRSEDKYLVFDYAIQLAAQGAEARVLSQPSILAAQGETAVIRAGDQEPIVQQNVSGTTVLTSTIFRDVGIRLEVQPLLVGRDAVRVRLVAEAARVSDFRITATSETQQVVNPVISSRSADTVVTVPDGETIVIGGLEASTDRDVSTGIPLLKDIPVLGYAFGSTTTRTTRSELIFWITLRIERPEEARLVVPPSEKRRLDAAGTR